MSSERIRAPSFHTRGLPYATATHKLNQRPRLVQLARESGVGWVVPGLVGEVVLGFGCFLSGRVRLFVGAVSRFSAESRVVAAH